MFVLAILGFLMSSACITVDLPSGGGDLFSSPFIVSGTMELDSDNQACSLFHSDGGKSYSLFQGPRLTNEEFDQLFEDGARVRLELNRRSDLARNCGQGNTVEVVDVLEFIPP